MIMCSNTWEAYVKGVKAAQQASQRKGPARSRADCPFSPVEQAGRFHGWMAGVHDYEKDPEGTLRLIQGDPTNDDDML